MIEKSDIADAKMRVFNSDGSSGGMAANPLRCVAKYLFDNGFVSGENLSVESCGVVKNLTVNSFNGKASSVSVNLGKPVIGHTETGNGISSSYNVRKRISSIERSQNGYSKQNRMVMQTHIVGNRFNVGFAGIDNIIDFTFVHKLKYFVV